MGPRLTMIIKRDKEKKNHSCTIANRNRSAVRTFIFFVIFGVALLYSNTSISGALRAYMRNGFFRTPQIIASRNPQESFMARSIKQNRTIYYVHTGKTGGTTLGHVLRACCDWFQNAHKKKECFNDFHQFNETRLSKMTKTHHHAFTKPENHVWLPICTSFLFTLRNPIDRAVSAFDMEHTRNTNENKGVRSRTAVFYEECFPNAEALAMVLAHKNHEAVNSFGKECYTLGQSTLIGNGHISHAQHLKQNYQLYARKTIWKYPEREVFVVRTEHLWEDLGALNLALGGSSSFQEHVGITKTHGSESYEVKSKLSKLGRATFCCHLHQENEIYVQLIQSSVNLLMSEKQKTLNVLYEDCGIPLHQYQSPSFSWKEWANSRCDPKIIKNHFLFYSSLHFDISLI